MPEPGSNEHKEIIPKEDYERNPPKNRKELYKLVKETISEGKGIAFIADFDDTQSRLNKDSKNPFEAELDPDCAKTQLRLYNDGVTIGVVSNRAAESIRQRFLQKGFTRRTPLIMGSYGYEEIDSEGKCNIDPRWSWHPYLNAIKHTLGAIRKEVMQMYDVDLEPSAETTIQSPEKNPIYLEIKGLNKNFPEGLAQVYCLNTIPSEQRIELVKNMNDTVDKALKEYIGTDLKKRQEVWGLSKKWGGKETRDPEEAAKSGNYWWSLEPKQKYNKGYGLAHLWEKIEKQSQEPLGLVIYAGDHIKQDGGAMWYGKFRERNIKGKTKFVGILVNKTEEGKENDIVANGVTDFSKLLSEFADTVHEAKKGKSSDQEIKKAKNISRQQSAPLTLRH